MYQSCAGIGAATTSTTGTGHGILTQKRVGGEAYGGRDRLARHVLLPVGLQTVQQRALARVVEADEQRASPAPPRRPAENAHDPRQLTPEVHDVRARGLGTTAPVRDTHPPVRAHPVATVSSPRSRARGYDVLHNNGRLVPTLMFTV